MNKIIYILVAVAVLAALFAFLIEKKDATQEPQPAEQTACTLEARACPDGSFVGREGPSCQFAVCPAVSLALGETAEYGSTNVTPLRITEDSRCPQDVQCIWAGTLLAEVVIESEVGEEVRQLSIGDRISTDLGLVVLYDVSPLPTEGALIPTKDYRLQFVEDR